MLVSVFTPTHRPDHLMELYNCLCWQTHKEWEWIVLVNGPERRKIHELFIDIYDKRIKLRDADSKLHGCIGALKAEACGCTCGELLVEVDHDDLITEDCLEALVTAASQSRSGRGAFVYSDSVTCDFDGNSDKFQEAYGWRHYPWTYKGKNYSINRTFPITPRSLCDVLYAPDHVRAWTASAYLASGGHNKELSVGDDHELVVRTYLADVPFIGIPRPLYIHRLNATTASQTKLPQIAQVSKQTRDRYLHHLINTWCENEKLPRYDLGGAHHCAPGFIPVDKYVSADMMSNEALICDVFDLPNRIPSNSVGCFRASDFLEHFTGTEVVRLMNMLYDLLVPGGWLITATPAVCYPDGRVSRSAFRDPTHKSFWSEENFWYFTDRNYAKYVPEVRCRFQPVRLETTQGAHPPYVIADLCAVKEGPYHPGPVLL